MAQARIYAATICLSAGAVASFVAYCKTQARELLRTHARAECAVEAIAGALLERETLTGDEIDAIVLAASASAAHEAEILRRETMAGMVSEGSKWIIKTLRRSGLRRARPNLVNSTVS
jgi:hypothetical protein